MLYRCSRLVNPLTTGVSGRAWGDSKALDVSHLGLISRLMGKRPSLDNASQKPKIKERETIQNFSELTLFIKTKSISFRIDA